jgi:hypothetical protein
MKTVLLAVIICLVSALNLFAQWAPAADTAPTYRTGDVGIGNAAPHSKLDVTGTARIGGQTIPTTGAGTEIEYLAGAGTGTVRVYDRSSALYKILSLNDNMTVVGGISGYVGIGTTTPSAALHIAKGAGTSLILEGDPSGAATNVNFAADSGPQTKAQVGGSKYGGSGGILHFSTLRNSVLTEALTIRETGNIGIGTTAPQTALHIARGAGTSLTLEGDPSGAATNVNFSADSGPQTKAQLAGSKYGGTGGILHFSTLQNSVLTEAMTIRETGNVGIGTTTPNAALEVFGNQAIFRQSGGGANVQLGDLSANSTSYFTLANSNSATNWRIASNNNIAGGLEFIPSTAAGGNTYAASTVAITNTGRVGIGLQNPSVALDVAGSIHAAGNISGGTVTATYQDLAEWVPSSGEITAGTVVIVSESVGNTVVPSTTAYDTRVAGVVSSAPGLLLGVESPSKSRIATSGRVKVRVDASTGAIHLGDLLVTSDKPGLAMKSEPIDVGGIKIHRPGTLIGKALEPLASGKGEILVLLSLQ